MQCWARALNPGQAAYIDGKLATVIKVERLTAFTVRITYRSKQFPSGAAVELNERFCIELPLN